MEVEVETEVEEERAKDKEEKEDRVRLTKKEEGRERAVPRTERVLDETRMGRRGEQARDPDVRARRVA